ncbi:hypothetical protein [uncultured Aquimarina sp.]|uniref:hypothetical protein n=1 Tax=uncultured Aquimarina sp. TaxID=575652 RepID=UPI0026034159|nr:hypothetical protein [uncultured Aquimarina sp.]
MKKHQIIFDKIAKLFKEQFKEKAIMSIGEYDDGYSENHLTIENTGVWISCDEYELIFGTGFNHRHYNPEFDELLDYLDEFQRMLTKRKRKTDYFKDNYCYKTKLEVESADGNFQEFSTSSTWYFSFWKKTTEKVAIEKPIIDSLEFENAFIEIKNYAQHDICDHSS